MKRKHASRAINIALLLVLLAIVLLPLFWNIMMSFDEDVLTTMPIPPRMWPKEPSMRNYKYAFEVVPLARYFLNTFFLTVVNTAIAVFSALTCGYAFAKGKFFLKQFWFVYMLAVMMIPFESIMMPLFLQYRSWGLLGSYWPLILGSFAYAFGTFLARQNIAALPDSLREATFIDGASEWRTFFSVILPLSGPVIATLCILQVIAQWNSFLWPLITISKNEMYVITVGVAMFNAQKGVMLLGPRMAVATLSALPLMVMFLFLQKYIVASVALSGIKQ
ncbi:MAG: carbohydrate ABC transporter permease [Clostridiales bacterium]|nr:carbohydrate ABC transporter permease [Clostridiales bacterium]